MSEIAVSDWWEGDDPGAGLWAVQTAKGETIQAADITSWSMQAYDLSGDPTSAITPDSNGSSSGTNYFNCYNVLTVDAYWTKDDIGYNVRHIVRNSDFTTTPLKAGHRYRFVYRLQTGDFDGGANRKVGQITLVREGMCKPRGGAA